ncbi:MAG: hypothetical protein ACKOQ6_10720 [Bacteroidota bacterium]
MSFEDKYDRFWMGSFAALIGAPLIYSLFTLLVQSFSPISVGNFQLADPRPIMFSSILLVLTGRWLLVNKKMENAGRGFFLILIPMILASLYFTVRRNHG